MTTTPNTTDGIKGMLADIQERNRRACACQRHHFPHNPDGYRLGQKHTCIRCEVPFGLVDIGHYIRGYMAAGGNPADVMPDWLPVESANGNVGVVR